MDTFAFALVRIFALILVKFVDFLIGLEHTHTHWDSVTDNEQSG